jgi:hypothetical protein
LFTNARFMTVTCVIACLVAIPWTNAFASERPAFLPDPVAAPSPAAIGIRQSSVEFGRATVNDAALSLAPAPYALQARGRQTVATTNEPKLLLGVAAGALIVTGVALIAYGATSTCKGLHESTSSCDKKTVIGAMSVSAGTVMLVVWGLSRP